MSGQDFKSLLDKEALVYFNEVAKGSFSQQAVAFLNAYWDEVGPQAEYIFEVSWLIMKEADMHFRGIQYHHKYTEGCKNELNAGLYFYEKLCKFNDQDDGKKWGDEYNVSKPSMMTTIARKKELKQKVDVNFDGCISMLEYLLYQYKDVANPADFCERSMSAPDEHPEIKKARLALEEVNKRIQAYESEKARLLDLIENGSGIKKLKAKNEFAQLESGPLKENLNRALITAEAAVRIVSRKFKGMKGEGGSGNKEAGRSNGAMFWMKKDLADKKARYGR